MSYSGTESELLSWASRLYQSGQFDQAARCCQELLKRFPQNAPAWHLAAMLDHQQRHYARAISRIRRAIELAPEIADFHNALGAILGHIGLRSEAIASFHQAIELRPEFIDAQNNLGVALEETGDLQGAIGAYRRGIALDPSYALAHTHLGNVLRQLDRVDEAIGAYRDALRLNSKSPDAQNNLGVCLLAQGHVADAIEHFRAAIALNQEHADSRMNLGMALLLSGQFTEGWAEYEWRRRRHDWPSRRLPKPEWDGSDLSGRKLLLYAEGGFGNTIQFFRFALSLSRSAGQVILECPAPLHPLLRGSVGSITLRSPRDPMPDFDVHAPLVSIPAKAGRVFDLFDVPVPYLSIDSARASRWSTTICGSETLNIGINWRADPNTAYGRSRSIPLELFAELARLERVKLISLRNDAPEPSPFNLTWLADLDQTSGAFVDTASVMRHLHLVITCDTATAHVAGALGVPLWVLLPLVPDWRWMLDRSDSPWYPTATLFRQQHLNDWASLMRQVVEAIVESRERLITSAAALNQGGADAIQVRSPVSQR